MPAFGEITPQNLLRKIGTPDCPPLFDCRISEDIAADPVLIPGAQHHDFRDETVPEAVKTAGTAIIYCQKGKKLSQGLAALWRAQGIGVEVVSGGHLAWLEQENPHVALHPLPTLSKEPTRWVTRQRPKIDRLACPWLIRRFIDPRAEFLFVPAADVYLVAEKFNAIPFDMADDHNKEAAWSHQGDTCTFDTVLSKFGIAYQPLQAMANIIRAADTNRHELSAQASGLLALSIGLSRQYRDDYAQMNAGMALYDALFRWARDGQNEGHDWEGTQ